MQNEPTAFAVAIGCKQLSLHNRCVSSVYYSWWVSYVTLLNRAIDIKSCNSWTLKEKKKKNRKGNDKRFTCIF